MLKVNKCYLYLLILHHHQQQPAAHYNKTTTLIMYIGYIVFQPGWPKIYRIYIIEAYACTLTAGYSEVNMHVWLATAFQKASNPNELISISH